MLLKQVKQADLLPIAASGTATKDIPALYNHHALLLNCISSGGTALTQAQIENDISSVTITLKQKGGGVIKLIDALTPAEILDLLNDYYDAGKATYTNAGVLRIPFTRPHLFADVRALSIGMADIEQYNVKVVMASGLATLDTCELIAEYDTQPTRPLGQHIRVEPMTRPNVSTGEEHVDEVPYGEPGTALLGYHVTLGTTPGVISYVKSKINGQDIYDPLRPANNNLNLRNAGRTPNSDYFHVPFDLKGIALDVGSARSFVQKFNWTTAPGSTYKVIPEVIHGMNESNAV